MWIAVDNGVHSAHKSDVHRRPGWLAHPAAAHVFTMATTLKCTQAVAATCMTTSTAARTAAMPSVHGLYTLGGRKEGPMAPASSK